MSDGTYKLILGDYCLLVCGTIDIVIGKNGVVTQTFRPIFFAIAASENTDAYTEKTLRYGPLNYQQQYDF